MKHCHGIGTDDERNYMLMRYGSVQYEVEGWLPDRSLTQKGWDYLRDEET